MGQQWGRDDSVPREGRTPASQFDAGRLGYEVTPPHLRLREWWTDDPADPDRMSLHGRDVQRLAVAIGPGTQLTDLGGVMSLDVRLDAAGLVLRVQQPFGSRQQLLAV